MTKNEVVQNPVSARCIVAERPAGVFHPALHEIREEWVRYDGRIFKIVNGKVDGVWTEREAPIAFVEAMPTNHE